MQLMLVVLLAGSSALSLLSGLLIAYLRFHRYEAFKGDASAARKLILPAFEPLLWLISGVNLLLTLSFSVMLWKSRELTQEPLVASEVVYAAQQFVVLMVLVVLLQKSVSLPALRRTAIITLLLSTYMIPVVWFVHHLAHGPSKRADLHTDMGEIVILVTRLLVFALPGYVLLHPPARASKGTLCEYCVFAAIYQTLLVASQEALQLYNQGAGNDKVQYTLVCLSQCWGLLSPLVIWRVLKADTEHWRGLGHSAYQQQQQHASAAHIILERISSEGLHVLIEMHRKHVIDFAYLELRERIGVGASSTVFHGLLYSKIAAAVKVYTPSEFTDEVVASFSHEAALCGSLHHPNVVKFYGMCVCPPTICLISERCRGSLDQVTKAMASGDSEHFTSPSSQLQQAQASARERREQLLVNLGFMLDAARSVAYLHSFSPAFVHRNIKPSNFLVDYRNNVKLTDFGESRCLPRAQIAPRNANKSNSKVVRPRRATTGDDNDAELPSFSTGGSLSSPPPPRNHLEDSAAQLTVKGTVDYMAPEIIQDRAGFATYGEAADVYALGVTFWDILYPLRDKFPGLNSNHLHIFQAVLDGQRPQFFFDAQEELVHDELRYVIQMAWAHDAHARPSAQYIVTLLERIQEHECARFAGAFRKQVLAQRKGQRGVCNLEIAFNTLTHTTSLAGAHAVAKMVELKVVECPMESIRLGNMLMDAGVLHHLKHSRPFEDSEDQLYFFYQYCIKLYDPIAILEDRTSNSEVYHNGGGLDPKSSSHSDGTAKAKNKSMKQLFTRQWTNHSNRALLSRIAGLRIHEPEASEGSTVAVAESGSSAAATAGPVVNEPGFHQCRCRKLSQRIEEPRKSVRHKFRQKFKGATAVLLEDHALTATLLTDGCDEDDPTFAGVVATDGGGGAAAVSANESTLRELVAAAATAAKMKKKRMVHFTAPASCCDAL
ncbi:Tkl protein kinase [Globisporangium polare]